MTKRIIKYLEKRIQLLQTAVRALQEHDEIERVTMELLTSEEKLDESVRKRSEAMRRAWERRKKD